ncbi:MAG: prepilin-type N-terminal cleavage/methylation domain-containing protein [Tissierellia bacterium]|nr:prepilin-type N-terminal cleavage/methylation domain-containing protein [Tissierellia bacterium]
MNNNKGFTLIEVIIGLFLLGIISVTFIPVLNTALVNIRSSNDKVSTILFAESIMEEIKYFNDESSENSYILDTNMAEVMDLLGKSDYVHISLPRNGEEEWDYKCDIVKQNIDDELWHITITIYSKGKKETKNVVLQAYVEKPERDQ